MSLIGFMPAQPVHEDVFEYRIEYMNTNDGYLSKKHFLAHSQDHALEIFRYACLRKSIVPEVISIDFWNRWANRWENQELLASDPETSVPASSSA